LGGFYAANYALIKVEQGVRMPGKSQCSQRWGMADAYEQE